MNNDKTTEKCLHFRTNMQTCTCTYTGCSKKGMCCQCFHYHRKNNELPACFFTPETEKTYDRSIRNFIANSRI